VHRLRPARARRPDPLNAPTLTVAAAVLTIAGDLLYIAGALRGPGEPEAVSWAVWAAVMGVTVDAAVTTGNLGDAAYLAACAAGCFTIGLLTVRAGLTWSWADAVCLAIAVPALGLLTVVHAPQGAAGLTMVADFTGYLPTAAKAWKHPHKEILLSWVLWAAGAACGTLATGRAVSLVTAWPWYLLATTGAMSLLLAARGRSRVLGNRQRPGRGRHARVLGGRQRPGPGRHEARWLP
jgi:hypothetical protein